MYDNLYSVIAYVIRQKKIPNLLNPSTLTDKILKIKLSKGGKNKALRELVSDRLNVRNYVSKKSQECSLIDLLWTGVELDNDTWERLPSRFVIKANHGSKMVKVINKDTDNYNDIRMLCSQWLNTDYYKKGKEWVYKNLNRFLVIESFLDVAGDVPPDYKFFCLNGKVKFVQVDLDRFNGHARNIYSPDFELINVSYQFPQGNGISEPHLFKKAISIAEELSSDFDFIRVDLYIMDDNVFFGELTNFPGNCLEKFSPQSFDIEMGKYLKLEL